jgi:monoterpene epsilon-lactone hydrolase
MVSEGEAANTRRGGDALRRSHLLDRRGRRLISAAHGWWESEDVVGKNPYFKNVNASDTLAFPARSAQVMARFPPSLLIAGTRDVALSSGVFTHSLLVAQGVHAELHIWEGLGHGFFLDPDLPQSREVYSVTVKFFDTHLGI